MIVISYQWPEESESLFDMASCTREERTALACGALIWCSSRLTAKIFSFKFNELSMARFLHLQ